MGEEYTGRQKFVGGLRVLCAGLIWGLIPIFLRLTDGSTFIKVWMRVLISALSMFIYLGVRGRLGSITALGRKKIIEVATQGVILTANWIFFLLALDGAGSVALGELLGYTSPIFIAILAPLVLGEKFDKRVMVAVALALIGLTFILAPGDFTLTKETLWRAAMGLVSACTVTLLTLRGKRAIRGVPGDVFMLIENASSTVIMTPIALYFLLTGQGPTTTTSWLLLIFGLGGICTALASFIYMEGFKRIRADHVAVLSYSEPISAIIFTALLPTAAAIIPALSAAIPAEAEPFTIYVAIGAALVVSAGVYIMRLEKAAGTDDPAKEVPAMEFPEDL